MREGFLVGIGGGASLRVIGDWVEGRLGRIGRECVDALDVVRVREGFGDSRVPSREVRLEEGCCMYGGTISFLAIELGAGACLRLDIVGGEDIEFGVVPLKSTVWEREVPLGGGSSGLGIRLTSTQSGSGLGVNGLLGRLGLGR